MSFSTDVKEELSKLNNLANKSCIKAEMYGYLCSSNLGLRNNTIKFATESEYNINRFSKILNNLNISKYEISIKGKNFNIVIPKKNVDTIKKIYEEYKVNENEAEQKAYVRGVFLGGGSINNPKNKYHIEILVKNALIAENIIFILNKYNINLKILNNNRNIKDENKNSNNISQKEKISIYSKDGEEISKFLAFIEASSSMLKFEEIRVLRDMRNNINRIVNCETANLAKTVSASVKQINAINKLKNEGKFNKLPENLKEIANLRIANPEASLAELGQMLSTPIGKSGVNYRLNSIIKFAE